ncbi:U3 small nucleolar RNA-associated protein [Lachnellula hyalina]|uniref:U3 small nucleolar RNA-associated protein n=1 Tax=Lachnellula hyalina TaxID=1316788 RepID=A0A8H8QZ08_9HELO|nr:U3 small nucleolar RNA-associated protein [Lachnellula hyalina]TVY24651.1 U3 small nucleolar RNA-associated protein [Lachnellula hyalina]
MSGPSDKARFHMEQAVPQLQEFKEKKIFTDEEIRTLVKKRSDFEHKICGRGSTPVDFARYAAWEMSLEHLRLKRCKRLRIKGSSTFSGQARIYKIFDRGTERHKYDVALWMSYLECAREAKATQKFKTILTSAIRLHPTIPDFWLYAARWALQSEADMNGARSYMQRGTRFCIRSKELWIEYAKLEMIYLAKIAARRKILGLDADESEEEDEEMENANADPAFDIQADVISIPDFNGNSLRPKMMEGVKVDSEANKDPMTTPALNGAIPLAIFDAARKQPFFCASAAGDFFDMFATFTQVRCLPKILQHVLDSMTEAYDADPFTCNCYVRQPFVGLDPNSPKFPGALGVALDRLKESTEKTKDKKELAKKTRAWIEPILKVNELDPGIQTVLKHTLRKLDS